MIEKFFIILYFPASCFFGLSPQPPSFFQSDLSLLLTVTPIQAKVHSELEDSETGGSQADLTGIFFKLLYKVSLCYLS